VEVLALVEPREFGRGGDRAALGRLSSSRTTPGELGYWRRSRGAWFVERGDRALELVGSPTSSAAGDRGALVAELAHEQVVRNCSIGRRQETRL
jgi:hypothetical protein